MRALIYILFMALAAPVVWAGETETAPSASTPSSSPASIQETVLDNGLKVVLLEEHKAPVVTFQVWYKAGSRNEVTGKTGVSHLVEHMMFKGTTAYGKGTFSKIVAKNGGTENAFTGRDYTAYFETFASDKIDLSLSLESDRMQNLLMDPAEVQLERNVVKEERRTRTDDDPYAALIEQLYGIAFVVHPYHAPVIGWMEDISHLERDDLYRYYKSYYVPNNATIVVVGDFDAGELLPRIKTSFEKISRGPTPPQRVPQEPSQKGERRVVLNREAQLVFLSVGYPTVNYKSPDTYPLTVLAHVLSSGKSARLYRSLVYSDQVALDTGGHYEGLTIDPGLFYLYATAPASQSEKTLEMALDAEVKKVQDAPISPDELQKVKNQIEADFIMSADSNFERAMQIGRAETVGAGHAYVTGFVENIKKVTVEDVMRVAKQYLSPHKKNTGMLLPNRLTQGAKADEGTRQQ